MLKRDPKRIQNGYHRIGRTAKDAREILILAFQYLLAIRQMAEHSEVEHSRPSIVQATIAAVE